MLNNPYNIPTHLSIPSLDLEEVEELLEKDVLIEDSGSIPAAIVINSFAIIFATGQGSLTFDRSHQYYEEAKNIALKYLDSDQIPSTVYEALQDAVSVKKRLLSWSNNRLSITGNTVTFDGDAVPEEVEKFLLDQFEKDPTNSRGSLDAWSKFIDKLRDAVSLDIHNRLFAFLSHNDLSIDEEGNVLCWKVVRSDYKDKHSGTVDYSVGNIVTMPKTKVDNNPNKTCSYGLHACAFSYLKSFANSGDPVLLIAVDPSDIIAVPTDYYGAKIRASVITSVAEVGIWGVTVFSDSDTRELVRQARASA